MKELIKMRNDDKVSLLELQVGSIYGVSMNYYSNGGTQLDIMIIKSDDTGYYFESLVLGCSYPTRYKSIQSICEYALSKPEIYKVFVFDNLIKFFEWGNHELSRLMKEFDIPASKFNVKEDYLSEQ